LGAKEECLKALETAKNRGSLPEAADILADPDMKTVKNQPWFLDFMETLQKKPEPIVAPEVVPEPKSEAEPVKPAEPVVEQKSEPEAPKQPQAAEVEEPVADEAAAIEPSEDAPVAATPKVDESAFKGQHFKQ
jgi:hypothetical protein